jgi:hypothetical protein
MPLKVSEALVCFLLTVQRRSPEQHCARGRVGGNLLPHAVGVTETEPRRTYSPENGIRKKEYLQAEVLEPATGPDIQNEAGIPSRVALTGTQSDRLTTKSKAAMSATVATVSDPRKRRNFVAFGPLRGIFWL